MNRDNESVKGYGFSTRYDTYITTELLNARQNNRYVKNEKLIFVANHEIKRQFNTEKNSLLFKYRRNVTLKNKAIS